MKRLRTGVSTGGAQEHFAAIRGNLQLGSRGSAQFLRSMRPLSIHL